MEQLALAKPGLDCIQPILGSFSLNIPPNVEGAGRNESVDIQGGKYVIRGKVSII